MALKPFSVKGEFSGRTTPIAGGPKISRKHSTMDVTIFQCDGGEEEPIVRVDSEQNKRRITSKVTVYPKDGSEPQVFEIETRY